MNPNLGRCSAILLILLAATAAQADPLIFEFRGAPDIRLPVFHYAESKNSITWNLAITAIQIDGATTGPALVTRNGDGHGAYSKPRDNEAVDGRIPDEALVLDFDRWFKLGAAEFEGVSGIDTIFIKVDGNLLYSGLIQDLPGSYVGPHVYHAYFPKLMGPWKGTQFEFGTTGWTTAWRLASITMPEPDSMALLGTALCLGAFARRRRRRRRA